MSSMSSKLFFLSILIVASVVFFLLIVPKAIFYRKANSDNTIIAAIDSSSMDALDKSIFKTVARSDYARDTGLLKTLFTEELSATVVWRGIYLDGGGRKISIVLVDRFVRPVASSPIPLIALGFDAGGALIFWDFVAPYSLGFVAAEIEKSEEAVLAVTTRLNWTRGFRTDRYVIRNNQLKHVEPAQSRPVSEGEWNAQERKFLPPMKALQEAINA